MGPRRSEQGHDLVAHELVDGAAVALDARNQTIEAGRDEAAYGLGVELLRERGEAGDIREEDGDDPALAAGEGADGTVAPRRAGGGR
jgi:hypothetical protein